jgi:O-antigen ligase
MLLLSMFGEGGASAAGLLVVHAAVVALGVAAILDRRSSGEARALAGPAAWALSAFALLAVAGAAVAPYRFAAFLVLQEIAAFSAVALVAARCGSSLAVRLGWPLLAGAAFEGGVALVQRLGGDLRPAGTFLNPNHLSAWLSAALLIGAGTAVSAGRAGVLGRVALAVPGIAALVLGGSRGAFLGLLAGAGWLLGRRFRGLGRWGRRTAVAVVAVLAFAAVAGIVARFDRGDALRYQRLSIWKASLGAVAQSPWTGAGPGQFATAAANLNFPLFEGPLRFARSFETTHSDLLRLPAEFGLPAALAALAGLALAGREIARRRRSGAIPAAADGAVAALVALAVQAMVDNLSERPALHLLVAALLGSLLATDRAHRAPHPGWRVRAAAAAALVLLFAIGDVAPYLAWRTVQGLPRGRLDAAGQSRLAAALSWNPLHPDLWLRRAEYLASGPGWSPPVYAAAREAAERAVVLDPADARYRVGVARVEALACTTLFRDEATRARASARYDEAAERTLHDPFPWLERGGFLLDAGDPGGARRAAEQALRIEPEAVPARVLLAEAALAEDRPAARRRAAVLLSEAEGIAQREASRRKESAYERQLLSLDSRRVAALRARLAAPGS